MNALLIALSLVAADPNPNRETFIYNNQMTLLFSEAVKSREITIIDSKGCKVNWMDEIVGDSKIIVHMKACEQQGYPSGDMIIKYVINGVPMEHKIHIRHHH